MKRNNNVSSSGDDAAAADATQKPNKRPREEAQQTTTTAPQYGSKEYWEARYKSHLPDADVRLESGNDDNKYVLDGIELSKEAINAGHAWYFTYEELRPLILPLILGSAE